MIEQGFGFYIIIAMILLGMLLLSCAIPLFGYIRKRWKGMAIGCLLQPVCCAIFFLLVVFGASFYQMYEVNRFRKDSMVSVRKVGTDSASYTWHLKPDEECFFERRVNNPKSDFLPFEDASLFDVVPVDSTSVCVDDHIVVKFDFKARKATATEYDKPLEVVSVDWDKVESYFHK